MLVNMESGHQNTPMLVNMESGHQDTSTITLYLDKWEADQPRPQQEIQTSCHSSQILVKVFSKLGIGHANFIESNEG